MMCRGFVFGLALVLAAEGADKIPRNPETVAAVAAGKCYEARVLWWGFDPTDATASLQAAINSGAHKLIVENPGAPWIVDQIHLASDQEIFFDSGVVVQAKRGAFHAPGDCLFSAALKTNITLTGHGATWRMWKNDYDDKMQYKHSEWRHVLSFTSCAGVQVAGLTLADSGGDGIYLGVARKGVPCSDVVIRDVICTNNYRQGISVISARNLLIENCTLTDTWGSAPEAGIDFEPNMPTEELANCVMRNCISANNRGDAYTFYLAQLHKDSRPIAIRLENCRAEGCQRSLAFVTGSDGVTGTMEFKDCSFHGGQRGGIVVGDKPASGARVSFRNCTVSNAALTHAAQAPIELANGADAVEEFGAVQFDQVTVHDPLGRMPPLTCHDPNGMGLRDVGGELALQRSNETAQVFQLTPALLAKWLPHTSFKPIPKFMIEGVRYEPALPQAQPDAKARSIARQRDAAEWLIWAEAGKPTRFTVLVRKVGKPEPLPAAMQLVAPSGKITKLPDTAPGEDQTAYDFLPAETGAYTIHCALPMGTASINSDGSRVCLYAPRSKFHLLSTTGEFFFWVPAGTKEFGIKVTGDNAAERVKAALCNPIGKVVEEADSIFETHQFVAVPLDPAAGEIWSLRLAKPTTGVLEDFFVHLQGVPPVLTHTREALLKPAR